MGALELENGGVIIPRCFDDDDEEVAEYGSASQGSVEEAVEVLLRGLGEDIRREGIKKTPLRVARAFRDGTRGYKQNVDDIVQGALFPESSLNLCKGHAGGSGGLVAVRDINLFSYCESCLLPFRLVCHVGYVPSGQRVVGLSKLARVADVFSKRLQSPQRLAHEICSALQTSINPGGVAVVLQCWHIQMVSAEEPLKSSQSWSSVHVRSTSGVFDVEKSDLLEDFLTLLKFQGMRSSSSNHMNGRVTKPWCPMLSSTLGLSPCSAPTMIRAVTSIISSIGEDPNRNELVGTPLRFVQWLMQFKKSSLGINLNGMINNQNDKCFDSDPVLDMFSELNIPFCAQCEHHLLPFHGVVHIGYYRSKIQDATMSFGCYDQRLMKLIVQFYGSKLQVQERLTRQIAETVFGIYNKGVMVVVEADHVCMISRGVEKLGSNTATVATLGIFLVDSDAKAGFLKSIVESSK